MGPRPTIDPAAAEVMEKPGNAIDPELNDVSSAGPSGTKLPSVRLPAPTVRLSEPAVPVTDTVPSVTAPALE